MEDDREKVFASIRRFLRGLDRFSANRSSKSPLTTEIAIGFESRFAQFKSELSALGGKAVAVDSEAAAAEYISDRMAQDARVFIYNDISTSRTAFTSLITGSRQARFALEFGERYDKREAASFDCALTGCLACVAETGTVVVKTLAMQLFVIAGEDQLIPTLDELFTDRFSKFEGSNLFLITGPSRTADIEKELVTGVHGPKDVFVIFIKR
jgi:L-lactate utilization protein LutC